MTKTAARVSPRHIWWLIAAPRRLAEFEHQDMKRWTDAAPMEPYYERAVDMRTAIGRSLIKSAIAALGGGVIAFLALAASDAQPASLSMVLAIIGALLILFGTLSLGDAATQSLEGTSLIERTNKAVYETLLCLGTAFLVAAGIVAI